MKTLALFLVAAFGAFLVGCQENAVEPIVAQYPAKAAPAIQKIQINERIEIKTPDGMVGFADVFGEITYRLVEVDQASLKKEIPAFKKYSVMISGKGEMLLSRNEGANSLGKPNTWTFSGSSSSIVEEGGEFLAAFRIEGSKFSKAEFHMGFLLKGSRLERDLVYVDFHEKGEE